MKRTVMNTVFGFKVEWTVPAFKSEWCNSSENLWLYKKDAEIEINRQKLNSKVPKIEFRIKKMKI